MKIHFTDKAGNKLIKYADGKWAYQKLRKNLLKEIGKCQICNSIKNLELHHKEYNKCRNSVMLLCRKCHRKLHRIPIITKMGVLKND